jgi:hypothetical protein
MFKQLKKLSMTSKIQFKINNKIKIFYVAHFLIKNNLKYTHKLLFMDSYLFELNNIRIIIVNTKIIINYN